MAQRLFGIAMALSFSLLAGATLVHELIIALSILQDATLWPSVFADALVMSLVAIALIPALCRLPMRSLAAQ